MRSFGKVCTDDSLCMKYRDQGGGPEPCESSFFNPLEYVRVILQFLRALWSFKIMSLRKKSSV